MSEVDGAQRLNVLERLAALAIIAFTSAGFVYLFKDFLYNLL